MESRFRINFSSKGGPKMAQIILEFRLAQNKHEAIAEICKRLGIQVIQVPRADYGQKLGALAGVAGFKKEKKVYSGPELPAEITASHSPFLTDRIATTRDESFFFLIAMAGASLQLISSVVWTIFIWSFSYSYFSSSFSTRSLSP